MITVYRIQNSQGVGPWSRMLEINPILRIVLWKYNFPPMHRNYEISKQGEGRPGEFVGYGFRHLNEVGAGPDFHPHMFPRFEELGFYLYEIEADRIIRECRISGLIFARSKPFYVDVKQIPWPPSPPAPRRSWNFFMV